MNMKPIIEIENRKLFYRFSIISYDYMPIVFVASDEKRKNYLCHCSEFRNGIDWVVTATDLQIIDDMIHDRITIKKALERGSALKYIVRFKLPDGFTSRSCLFDEIDPLDLPDDDLFVDGPDDEAYDGIRTLANETQDGKVAWIARAPRYYSIVTHKAVACAGLRKRASSRRTVRNTGKKTMVRTLKRK